MRMSGQTPEKGPGKHRKILDPGEYRKKGGIPASAEKGDPGEYQKCGIWVSTGKVTSR